MHDVSIAVDGSGPVALQGGDGSRPRPPARRRADYTDLTSDALIFVRTPARDSTVSSPVHLAGTADTFEATFQIDIRQDGKARRHEDDHRHLGLRHPRHLGDDARPSRAAT